MAFAWAIAAACTRAAIGQRVETPLGSVNGILVDGVERYAGIPYALPPLGPLRFAAAELWEKPWGDLDARRYGAPCINNPLGDPRSMPLDPDHAPEPSEDCLTLNIWRPANTSQLPVMVYNFGGGLCSGYAGNPYFNGSKFATEHHVMVVTVSYRLGALGFMPSEDFEGPGNGGMNGIRDIVTALRWIQRFIPYFQGDPKRVTVFGQSSGAYATCTLSVAPEAKGLFQRAILQSGPCFGMPNRGWGPRNMSYGFRIAKEVMTALNVSSLEELRAVPAEKVQWPAYTMNDPTVAPYFSGYFEDPGFLPAPAEKLWSAGKMMNVEAIMVGFNSKDGTAAFYGVAPTLGLVSGDENQTSASDYEKAIRHVWGSDADAVLKQYPVSRFGSVQKAFLQVDADSMVICPSYQLLQYAQAWVPSYAFEFAHFIPSQRKDGFGCSNGPELDVAPPRKGPETKLFAMHGDEVKFVFGNEVGPDGLGPPNNRTACRFTASERALSAQIRRRWASFASGQPVMPRYAGKASLAVTEVLSDHMDDLGIFSQLGRHAEDCDFWRLLHAAKTIQV